MTDVDHPPSDVTAEHVRVGQAQVGQSGANPQIEAVERTGLHAHEYLSRSHGGIR